MHIHTIYYLSLNKRGPSKLDTVFHATLQLCPALWTAPSNRSSVEVALAAPSRSSWRDFDHEHLQDHAKSCCCFWPAQGCPAQHPWTSSKQRPEKSEQVRQVPFFCRWPLLIWIKSTKKRLHFVSCCSTVSLCKGYSDSQIELKLSQVHVKPPGAVYF